ncbi:DUF5696 domain-containing protein [Paenibacillus sp. LHD-117]|uniref:DUF5696 domain-containing protein n=1 Tax=Paenibacillus sp. LHD-117 TaxID=3071412 RepID=UPI0027E077B8|nr:DUF5696 domain-containing protein [Paenibacillus sp. LHD-117]MDQ6422889.1 DUF5696 domain-containing protein [Paenibacillus sp. LHD-117]
MRRLRIKWVAALACLLAAVAAATWIYFGSRGVPAIKPAAYVQAQEAPQTSELSLRQDGLVPDMRLAAESPELGLYFNEETAEFAVLDKRGGNVWRSNPADRDNDGKASSYEKEALASQLAFSFRDNQGRLETYSSFGQSVSRGQFQAEAIAGGLRVTYTLGDMSLGIEALPKLISKARMEEKIYGKVDEAGAKYVSTRYLPQKSNPDVLERLDTAVARELVLKRMIEIFQTAGYTEEDLAFDNEDNGIGAAGGSDKPSFTIPLDVRLDGESLVVSVPTSQIQESEGYRIRMLNMLSFFGAAGIGEQGYMMVPDGSGSLIYLNNGKSNQEVYAQRVYGEDENDNSGRRGQVAQSARLPVFGLKSGDAAWYAVVEKGDGIATVNADVSGRNNSYNNVFAGFALRGEDELELYKGNRVEEIQLLTEERYAGDIEVRYSFLSGDKADYSGMAEHYRNGLEASGVLKPLADESELPFFVTMLGAVDKRKSFLGVPYQGLVSMTTFDQAGAIADRLAGDGITNVRMRYMGWFGEGVNHEAPDRVKTESILGGAAGMRELASKLEGLGGKLYPDVAFQHVFREDGRFAPAADAARFVTREQAERTPYNRAFNSMDYELGIYYLLSPAKLPYYAEKFLERFDKLKLSGSGLALRDLGDKLHADYRTKRIVFRDTAKQIVQEQLGEIKDAYSDLLVAGGNAYAFPYADRLINVPTDDSGFNLTDETIPFYQIVLHGYADYAGEPINLSNDQDIALHTLQSIELGMAPHFLWTHESSSKLKFTTFDAMYSTEYASWYDEAVEMYNRANEALSGVRTARIADHLRHSDDVTETRYDNGISVYVNYSDKAATVNGTTIEGHNFAIGGRGR